MSRKLTYCPDKIELNAFELESITLKGSENEHLCSSSNNVMIVVKKLLEIQDTLSENQKISYINCSRSQTSIQVQNEGVIFSSRPMIVINRGNIYDKLKAANIINAKNNPASKVNITITSNYNIIKYFNNIAWGLLSYFRCADDFFRMKSIVNWFIRYSAISTIKHKHKLASRKAVLDKYGIDLTFTNQEGKSVSLIRRQEVMALRKEYLIKPDTEWTKKMNQI